MAKTSMADVESRLEEVVSERGKLEKDLEKAQAELRKVDRQEPDRYAAALAPVNDLKRKIRDVSLEHAQLASAVTVLKGGRNHAPQPE